MKNLEHYTDTTAGIAMKNIEEEERRFQKLLHLIFDICELAGFEIQNRIILVDKETGRIWR